MAAWSVILACVFVTSWFITARWLIPWEARSTVRKRRQVGCGVSALALLLIGTVAFRSEWILGIAMVIMCIALLLFGNMAIRTLFK